MIDVGDNADATWFVGEGSSSLDFGKHGAGFEITCFDVLSEIFDFDTMNSLCLWGAEIDVGIRDGSDGDEDVSFDFFGKTFGGEIFIDDSVDALEAF